MRAIRGFDFIYYGDGTNDGQQLIDVLDLDQDAKTIRLTFFAGNTSTVIRALQQNSVIYTQAESGLYEMKYKCGFKNLDATAVPELSSVTLRLVEAKFYQGVTNTDYQ